MEKYYVSIISVLLMVLLTGCGSSVEHATQTVVDEIVDQTANVVQSVDENVLAVKTGHPNSYPDISYEDAFENYFGDPTWKSFKGTQEGPDEDGDGKPDYTKNDVDVVEFTGYCMYQDVRVKALIQFVLNKEEGTFTSEYLSFNDVPQNKLMLLSLIDSAFTDYQEDHITSNSSNDEMEKENTQEKSEQEGTADYLKYTGAYFDGAEIMIELQLAPEMSDGSVGTATITFYDGEENKYTLYHGDGNTGWNSYDCEYVFWYTDQYGDIRCILAKDVNGDLIIEDASEDRITYLLERME